MRWSQETDKLMPLLADVQANLAPVVKNAANPFFNSNYADLNSVWHTLSGLLNERGLVVTQGGAMRGDRPVLVTRVTDSDSCQWFECEFPLDGGKTDPQGIGSAITYQRRYSLCAMFNLMLTDDDGNAATHAPQQRKPQPQQRPAPQQTGGSGFDASRVVIMGFKPKTEKAIGEMGYADATDAKQLAEWRVEHPGKNPKYVEKNRADAQEDVRQLTAYLAYLDRQDQGATEYATNLPDHGEEPPF